MNFFSIIFAAGFLFLFSMTGCGSSNGNERLSDAEEMHRAMLSAKVVEPQNEDERKALELLATRETNTTFKAGSLTVTIRKSYHSASGYLCKSVMIRSQEDESVVHRTACEIEQVWVYVPKVCSTVVR